MTIPKKHLLILLVLLTGCTLRSTPAPTPTSDPLAGTEWQLTHIRGQPVLPDYPIYLHLWEEKMTGEMSCNSYRTEYQAKDGTIQIKLLAVTVQLCPDKNLMNQEKQYTQAWEVALGQPASYRLEANTLEVLDDSGMIVLSFHNARSGSK